MTADRQAPSRDKVARFWERFRNQPYKQGVKEKAHRWYATHVERFIDQMGSRRLADQQPSDVVEHLDNLSRDRRLEDWQLAQAAHAIQIWERGRVFPFAFGTYAGTH